MADHSVQEIKDLLEAGSELRFVPQPRCPAPYGHWELRHRASGPERIGWDVIERLRRSAMAWLKDNTEEVEDGTALVYRHKQKRLI